MRFFSTYCQDVTHFWLLNTSILFFRFPNNTQRLVLYKEKNMLLTESELCRRNAEYFPQPERRQKVKKSMGAIKQVLGERKRERFSKIALMRESGEEISG